MDFLLQKGWHDKFAEILRNCNHELTISSPFVSDAGVNFLLEKINSNFKKSGIINFVTDLSPQNIYTGSTNPNSLKTLVENSCQVNLWHLPKLHAKVYVSDISNAIITSGNLTAGGLFRNFEYGVWVSEHNIVSIIKEDLLEYSSLGAKISFQEISSYCEVSEEIKSSFKQKESSIKKELSKKFSAALQQAEEKLLELRLAEGPIHSVFEKTVLYLLKRHNSLTTQQIHQFVEQIHPDLCDENVDRTINGKRFGKKWKHAVRTAQQHLKKKGMVVLIDGNWILK